MKIRRLVLLVLATALCAPRALSGQTLPYGPVRALDGEVLVSGEIVGTFGESDHIAYFNYTDYEHNALRLVRLSVSAAWRPFTRLALVGELRSEDFERPEAYAAYVRIRPWANRAFDIQAGRIPPTFGAFSRRAYTTDNPVIGYPLAYQYLTSIRPDAVPASAEDLLRMRARGWLSSYPVGDGTPSPGVPLVTAFRWDTGVQAKATVRVVELTGAVTTGTLSDPHVADNNGGPQISGRVSAQPVAGLVVGASAARGAWVSSAVTQLLGRPNDYTQTAWGADAEYSRDHWLVRSELVWSRWHTPFAATAPAGVNLDALAAWVEGRYRLTPRIFAGARLDHLGFSSIANTARTLRLPWDAPVNRFEVAAGYYLQRNLVARASVQRNDREAGRVRKRTYVSGQLSYWF